MDLCSSAIVIVDFLASSPINALLASPAGLDRWPSHGRFAVVPYTFSIFT